MARKKYETRQNSSSEEDKIDLSIGKKSTAFLEV